MKQSIASTMLLLISLLSAALADSVRGVKGAPRRRLKDAKDKNPGPAPGPNPKPPTSDNQFVCGPTSCCCRLKFNGINNDIQSEECTIGDTDVKCAPGFPVPPVEGQDDECARKGYDYVALSAPVDTLSYGFAVYDKRNANGMVVGIDLCVQIPATSTQLGTIVSHGLVWKNSTTPAAIPVFNFGTPAKPLVCLDISNEGPLKDQLGNCPQYFMVEVQTALVTVQSNLTIVDSVVAPATTTTVLATTASP